MKPFRLVLVALGGASLLSTFAACSSGKDSPEQCTDLANAASAQLSTLDAALLACTADTDCVWTPVNSDGYCALPCGGLTNTASVATLVDDAARVCEDFNAHGCTPPFLSCPSFGTPICAGGTCALYSVYLSPPTSTTFAVGACVGLDVDYSTLSGSSTAPHDITVAVTASNGTLYADQACTKPLATGTITIPAGASQGPFGFEPQVAGPGWIDVGGGVWSFGAQ
jgi:hypothetical protein